jgi:hypothetical protein
MARKPGPDSLWIALESYICRIPGGGTGVA